jgi:hypothetical protein
MAAKRDPRLQPIPGDVLSGKTFDGKGTCIRKVTRITPGLRVEAATEVHYTMQNDHKGRCMLGRWQKWAATARITHWGKP